jgi:choline kinase
VSDRSGRRAVVLAAGVGRRLLPWTADRPKCMVDVNGWAILDWILASLRANGVEETVVVRGHRGEAVRRPGLRFVDNHDYAANNILGSLMCANGELADGAVVSYSDILYDAEVVRSLLESPADIAIAVDRDWRPRYEGRAGHPEDEAELVRTDGDRVVDAGKGIPYDAAFGEFIGLLRVRPAGAAALRAAYDDALARCGLDGRSFQRAATLRVAYLTDMFTELAARGVPVVAVPIRGRWIEIDVAGDLERARGEWKPV